MRTRIAAAAVAAAALATLTATACSSSSGHKDSTAASDNGANSTATAPATAGTSGTTSGSTSTDDPAGTPSTGAVTRTPLLGGLPEQAFLAALKGIDPSLAADPDKAVATGTLQCAEISADPQTADHLAAERFGTPGHPLSDAQGNTIDTVLKSTVCKS